MCVFVLQCGRVTMLSAFYPEVIEVVTYFLAKKGNVSKLGGSFRLPL